MTLFLIGILIGAPIGALAMCLIVGGKDRADAELTFYQQWAERLATENAHLVEYRRG